MTCTDNNNSHIDINTHVCKSKHIGITGDITKEVSKPVDWGIDTALMSCYSCTWWGVSEWHSLHWQEYDH